MKRAIYFSFLLFAGIIILAHATVPHHYHEDKGLCFASHCRNSKEAHNNDNNAPPNHHHEGNPNPDICTIDVVLLKSENNDTKIACLDDCVLPLILLSVSFLVYRILLIPQRVRFKFNPIYFSTIPTMFPTRSD